MTDVILASGSPSRLTLLRAAGIEPRIIVPGVDEDAAFARAQAAAGRRLSTAEQTQVLASAKGRAVLERLTAADVPQPALLIASDSMLELEGRAIGKPGTRLRARELWLSMGGKSATLHSGHFVAYIDPAHGRQFDPTAAPTAEGVGSTLIHTAQLSEAEVDAYIGTGEPLNVAGGLTIDGYGAAFVTGMDGDHTNVLGLSIPLLRTLCAELGVAWHTLWNRPSGASV